MHIYDLLHARLANNIYCNCAQLIDIDRAIMIIMHMIMIMIMIPLFDNGRQY